MKSGPSTPCPRRCSQIAWTIAAMCASLKEPRSEEPRWPLVPKLTRWAGSPISGLRSWYSRSRRARSTRRSGGAGLPARGEGATAIARRRLPAREPRGALAVHRGGTEEGAVEHAALEPDLHVALPGEADAAVRLDDVARDLHRALAEVRLRERGRARRLLGEMVERVGRVPDQGARGLELERHARELVLQRLEVADRDAERLARLRILDRHLDEARARAPGVRGEQHEPGVAHAARGPGTPGQRLARRALEDDGVDPPRAVDALDRRDRHPLRAALDEAEPS